MENPSTEDKKNSADDKSQQAGNHQTPKNQSPKESDYRTAHSAEYNLKIPPLTPGGHYIANEAGSTPQLVDRMTCIATTPPNCLPIPLYSKNNHSTPSHSSSSASNYYTPSDILLGNTEHTDIPLSGINSKTSDS